MNYQEQIIENEKKLLDAFKNKDLTVLQELLHDNLLFILPNGLTETKTGVLNNYRSGDTVMASISASDYVISCIDDTVIVSLNLELKGKYFDHVIEAKFRYIRIWKLFGETWKVIAGSGIQLSNDN
jgi:hypothetical protein